MYLKYTKTSRVTKKSHGFKINVVYVDLLNLTFDNRNQAMAKN